MRRRQSRARFGSYRIGWREPRPPRASRSMVRAVLRTPGVARVFAASLLGRIPAGALGLVLILRVRELGGGYADGGAVAGAFSLGYATAAPLVGRLVDARGQTRVLAATAVAVGAALAPGALPPPRPPPPRVLG